MVRKGAVIVYVFEQDQTGKVVYQWEKGYNFQVTGGIDFESTKWCTIAPVNRCLRTSRSGRN